MSSSSTASRLRDQPPKVGRDLLPAGRLVRVVAGILFLAASVTTATSVGLVSLSELAQVVLTVLIAGAAYTGLVWILGDRILTRIGPWLSALIVVLPLAVLGVLPFVPQPVAVGVDFYVALSLLVQAVIGYGGCEIVGIPTLLLRRRYTVYCVFNGVDVVERWLQARSRWVRWTLAVLAFLSIVVLSAIAEVAGSGVGYWAAYVLFLVVGFIANAVVTRRGLRGKRSVHSTDRAPTALKEESTS
ncbi:MAG: DUF6410 domain-containing protein [Candidatus Dormibacteraceae bacterium]